MMKKLSFPLLITFVLLSIGALFTSAHAQPCTPTVLYNYEVSSVDEPHNALFVSDSRAYIVGDDGLRIIDVSNPLNSSQLGFYPVSLCWGSGVHVSGSRAYITNGNCSGGLRIIDVSDPTNPTLLGNYPLSNSYGVYVCGSRAYVACETGLGLQIIDVSDPANPTLLGNYDADLWAGSVQVLGNTAYTTDGESGDNLRIIDVSDPANPTQLGIYTALNDAEGLYVIGNRAYVADGGSGLRILDVSDPANPTLLGTFGSPDEAEDVFVAGNVA